MGENPHRPNWPARIFYSPLSAVKRNSSILLPEWTYLRLLFLESPLLSGRLTHAKTITIHSLGLCNEVTAK